MVKVTFIEFSGAERVLDIEPGQSVMQGAVANGVRGVIAECGGACSCGTCHVYVDPAWFPRAGAIAETEQLLLEDVCDGQPNSRLSCQIKVTPELDGLIVRVPARQV